MQNIRFEDLSPENQLPFQLARDAIMERQDFINGVHLAETALEVAERFGCERAIGLSFTLLGICARHAERTEKSLEYHTKALDVFTRNNLLSDQANAKNNLGNTYMKTLDYTSAIKYFQEAVDLFIQIKDFNNAVYIQFNLVGAYRALGDLNLAISAADTAAMMIEEYNYTGSRVNFLYFFSDIFLQKKEFNVALNYLEQAEKELILFPNELRKYEILNLRGLILGELGMITEGLEAAEKAIQVAQKCGSKWSESQCYETIADLYEKKGDIINALENYQQCIDIFKTINALNLEAGALRKMGCLLIKIRNSKGFELLESSLTVAEKSGGLSYISDSHFSLYTAYKAANKSDLALRHLEDYQEVERQRFEESTQRQLTLLHSKQEIELQKKEAETQKLRAEQLESKLSSQATQLVTQTELLSKFRDELREIVRKYPSTEPGMREVKEKLKELPCKQIDWEKFEAEFGSVHPEFTKKLAALYPDLTRIQMKMCPLLRLNLKSFEIARLFCVTERAVEFHRLNIRKIMGLKKGQDLAKALENL